MLRKKTRASGAGVKAEDGVTATDRKQVRVDETSEQILCRVGGGNFSLGIREAARRLVEHGDVEPFTRERHDKRQS